MDPPFPNISEAQQNHTMTLLESVTTHCPKSVAFKDVLATATVLISYSAY